MNEMVQLLMVENDCTSYVVQVDACSDVRKKDMIEFVDRANLTVEEGRVTAIVITNIHDDLYKMISSLTPIQEDVRKIFRSVWERAKAKEVTEIENQNGD